MIAKQTDSGLSGQTLPRKGPPMGPCDNPDVIEIEEVLPMLMSNSNSKCCPMSLFISSDRSSLRDDALFNIIGGLVKDQTSSIFFWNTDLSTVCDNSFPVDMVFIFVILCYTFG